MRILIVEDELKTALMLQELIEWHPTYKVVSICDSVESSVTYLRQYQSEIDVVFMDIQLSDGKSFEIFEKVDVHLPVVFCTAYDEYMMQAFKNHGVDYILKPFEAQDIRKSIVKLQDLQTLFVHSTQPYVDFKKMLLPKPSYQSSFLIRFREKIYPIQVADIAYVYLENETAYLVSFKNERHPIFKSLDEIEKLISPDQFYRINRQMIINRKAIKEIETYFNQKICVHLNVPTPEKALVSRLKVSPFLGWIEM